MPIEPLLLSVTPILTFSAGSVLTNATGFFFQRGNQLFLVSSSHVFRDEKHGHFPDHIQIKLHTDSGNITRSTKYSISLYDNGMSKWIAGFDSSGHIDVAAIKIDKDTLPSGAIYTAFTP